MRAFGLRPTSHPPGRLPARRLSRNAGPSPPCAREGHASVSSSPRRLRIAYNLASREAAEEVLDSLFYCAATLVQRSRRRRNRV